MFTPTIPNMVHLGLDGFVWWKGRVESRMDPLHLGRAQIRIYSWHTEDKTLIPTEDLPWAHPSLPINGPTQHPTPPHEGDIVWGFFLDGKEGQFPIMLGIIPGIPEETPSQDKGFSDQRKDLENYPRPPQKVEEKLDGTGAVVTEQDKAPRYPAILNEPRTHRLARNESTEGANTYIESQKTNRARSVPTADGKTWDEPETAYKAKYPFNNAGQTESGHYVETDDTPKAERLHRRHRTGTYEEIRPDGSMVTRVVKDNYTVVLANNNVMVYGTVNVTVQGNCNLYVKKNLTLKVDGNMDWAIKGNWTATVDGNISLTDKGKFTHKSTGTMTWEAPKYEFK